MKMADSSYVTLALGHSFNGESWGNIWLVSCPYINTEYFCASVVYIIWLENVDPEKIGIIGIYGYGVAISATTMEPHIKGTIEFHLKSIID